MDFCFLLRLWGKNIGKNISGNLLSKYSQKLLDNAKKSATDPFKTGSNRAIQKNHRSKYQNKYIHTDTCFVLPNEYRTTDANGVLKAPGVELCRNACSKRTCFVLQSAR